MGSGNLTPGGLQRNFEAFTVVEAAPGEALDVSSWDRFVAEHSVHVGRIGIGDLERAERNVVRRRGGRRGGRTTEDDIAEFESAAGDNGGEDVEDGGRQKGTGRFLIAQVPRAGNRWTQVHLNREVVERFFQIEQGTAQRVYLVECREDGSYGSQEVRPCVYSQSNKNMRIEVSARAGEPYPEAGPPIAVFSELQVRSFAYMLLLPGEAGYQELLSLTTDLPKVGAGLPRVIGKVEEIQERWSRCPLL